MFKAFETPLCQLQDRLQLIQQYIDTIYHQKDQEARLLFRSPLSYSAVIISLYSSYENFVDDILMVYINQIVDKSTSIDELPTDIKTNNLKLSAEFINSEQRFKNFGLNKEEVINNIYAGKVTNKLLLKHGGNLSFKILSEYLNSLGITDLGNKIKKSHIFNEFYAKSKDIDFTSAEDYLSRSDTDTIFSTLNTLISQRNSIAHSWKSDDKTDFEIIRNEWIPFMDTFCRCLCDVVLKSYSKWLISNNKLYNPIHFKIFGSSIVGFYNIIINWQQNDSVIIKTENKLNLCKITSAKIHLNSQATLKIEGYKLDKDKPEKYQFFFSKSCAKSSIDEKNTNDLALEVS